MTISGKVARIRDAPCAAPNSAFAYDSSIPRLTLERFQRDDVITRFANDFSKRGKGLAVGLADIEDVSRLEAENGPRGRDVLRPDAIASFIKGAKQRHRDQNRDAFLASPNEASKLTPAENPATRVAS